MAAPESPPAWSIHASKTVEAPPSWSVHATAGNSAGPQNTPPAPQEKPDFPSLGEAIASPKYQPRSLFKDIGSLAYGAGTQAYGLAGDLGVPGFPTTEETRGELKKLGGWDPASPGQESYVKAGEMLPAIAGGAGLAKDLAVGGAKALGKLGTFASDIGKGLKPRALLEGVGKPSTISDVGETIQKKVEETLAKHIKDRGPQAKKLFDTYLAKGKESEGAILDDYKKSLASYYAEGVSSLSPDEAKAIHQAADRITGRAPEMGSARGEKVAPGMEALEKERRFWNDVASGYDVKGAEAIPAAAAKDIAKLLEKAIKTHAPKEFEAAIKGYQELSEPINKFNTAIGKKVTAKAGEFLPEISKTDPKTIPAVFFKSRRSAQELKELSGDPKFAEEAARDHVANGLMGKSTRKDVEEYLNNNRDWLQEFPKVQKQLGDVAKTLGRTEKTKTAAKWAGGIAGVGAAERLFSKTFGGP